MSKIESDKPLPSHTRLDYEECYAKVILESLFPEEYKDLKIADKPDLVNETTNIGVEVTSAVAQKHREAVRLWSTIPYVSPEQAERDKERMKQLGVEYQGGVQDWPSESYSASDIEQTPISEVVLAFQNKIEKLNSGQYRQFLRYDLFIHSEVWLDSGRAAEVLQILAEKNIGNLVYTSVFLTTSIDIFRFDLLKGNYFITPYDLYHNMQFDWAMKVRQMVEDGEKE